MPLLSAIREDAFLRAKLAKVVQCVLAVPRTRAGQPDGFDLEVREKKKAFVVHTLASVLRRARLRNRAKVRLEAYQIARDLERCRLGNHDAFGPPHGSMTALDRELERIDFNLRGGSLFDRCELLQRMLCQLRYDPETKQVFRCDTITPPPKEKRKYLGDEADKQVWQRLTEGAIHLKEVFGCGDDATADMLEGRIGPEYADRLRKAPGAALPYPRASLEWKERRDLRRAEAKDREQEEERDELLDSVF